MTVSGDRGIFEATCGDSLTAARQGSPVRRTWWRQAATAIAKRIFALRRHRLRRLRLCESLSLGERRFVAVVQFDKLRFLVGGTASSLVLLARLNDAGDAAVAAPGSAPIPQAAAGEGLP